MPGAFKGLTDSQWEKIKSNFDTKTNKLKRGRPRSIFRYVLNAILYVLITGCRWCDIPRKRNFGKRSTAHKWLGIWQKNGTFARVLRTIQCECNLLGIIDWDRGSIDGSFAAGKGGGEEVDYGFKGKGVTLHALIEGNGKPLAIISTAASKSEQKQVLPLLQKAKVVVNDRGKTCSAPKVIQMDKGYDSQPLRNEIRNLGRESAIPRKKLPSHYKQRRGRKPKKLVDRWKVERTFAWIQRGLRRLVVRWERKVKYWKGFISCGMILLWLKKLL